MPQKLRKLIKFKNLIALGYGDVRRFKTFKSKDLVSVVCNLKDDCPFKLIDSCEYLTSDLPHKYLYIFGEEIEKTCEIPLQSITKIYCSVK